MASFNCDELIEFCKCQICKDSGCTARIDRKDLLVLKGELLEDLFSKGKQRKKAADCIVFYVDEKNKSILIVELKSTNLRRALDQLKSSSERVKTILSWCPILKSFTHCEFYFFVAHKSTSTREFGRLINERVEINGKKHNIIPIKCGTDLIVRLKSYLS